MNHDGSVIKCIMIFIITDRLNFKGFKDLFCWLWYLSKIVWILRISYEIWIYLIHSRDHGCFWRAFYHVQMLHNDGRLSIIVSGLGKSLSDMFIIFIVGLLFVCMQSSFVTIVQREVQVLNLGFVQTQRLIGHYSWKCASHHGNQSYSGQRSRMDGIYVGNMFTGQ